MRILDIDMDFFQSEIHNNDTDSNSHLENENFKVWNEKIFIDFIENKCGLSKESKIKGRVFDHHVDTYWFAKELPVWIVINVIDRPCAFARSHDIVYDCDYSFFCTHKLSPPII